MKSGAVSNCAKFFILILLSISGKYVCAQDTKPPIQVKPASRLYPRAPDVMPGTLPEMREAAYWINKMQNPDGLVLSLTGIQAMNNAFQKRMRNPAGLDTGLYKLITQKIESSPGLLLAYPDLYSKTPAELSAITKEMVNREIKYFRKGKYGNMLAVEYSNQELDALESEMAYDKISSLVKIRPGITVEDVQLRILPSSGLEFVGLTDKNKTRWDLWNLDVVPVGSAVQILHVSRSGAALFVLSKNGYGWIRSEKVAFASKEKTELFGGPGNFIICTGDKIPYYTDAGCTYVSGWIRMGDRLPLAAADQDVVNVPVRQTDGSLILQKAWLLPDADVHKGYLPYTRKNVVVQSLKLLDKIYDWTGAWLGRNHATSLRDIFACFGFKLPGYGELMSAFNDSIKRMYTTVPEEKKYPTILANDPFITLQISSTGHSQLLMGEYNQVPVVYDTHGYGYTDSNGTELEIRRSNIGTVAFPNYFLKQDIIFVTLK